MTIAKSDVFLDAPFSDKETVKRLGARWNGTERRWFVPAGQDLAPFAQWLPALPLKTAANDQAADLGVPAEAPSLDNAPQLTIREFIDGVRKAVLGRYDHDLWLMGQVTSVKERKSVVIIELMDSEQTGTGTTARLEVKAFGNQFQSIARKLREATGQELAAGLAVRLKVRPDFDGRYHLGARILDIDPSVSIGAFELKIRQIRQKLTAESIIGANKSLPSPADYCRIAVIHPVGASGFEDFRRDADMLTHLGLCEVEYIPSTFGGANAEQSLLKAIDQARACHEAAAIDALVIIRGGGSKQGLMSLSTELLARAVCTFPAPVITGLGHADDDTLLDELAHKRCDTPSKTIAFIRDTIVARAREGLDAYQGIVSVSRTTLADRANTIGRLFEQVGHTATLRLRDQRESIEAAHIAVRSAGEASRTRLARQLSEIDVAHTAIGTRAPALLAAARSGLDALVQQVHSSATTALISGQARIEEYRRQASGGAQRALEVSLEQADRTIEQIRTKADGLLAGLVQQVEHAMNLVQALGPESTLARGFALVLDRTGKALTSVKAVRRRKTVTLRLKDGEIAVTAVKGE